MPAMLLKHKTHQTSLAERETAFVPGDFELNPQPGHT